MNIYFDMFHTFFKVGLFSFGGGYAMIPLVERYLVDQKRWLNKEEFIDVLAIAQATPGLFAVNMATYSGIKIEKNCSTSSENKQNKTTGWLLGLSGAFGVALPSIVVILLIAMFFREFKEIAWVEHFFMGVRPAVVALIAVPCFRMFKTAKITLHNIWIPVVACLLISCFEVSPVLIILMACLGGYIYGKLSKKLPQ